MAHGQNSILHHEVDESEEFLELTKLISLLGSLMNIEPSLTNGIESGLDNLLKSSNPTGWAAVVAKGSNTGSLDLFELINSPGLRVNDIEDLVLLKESVALGSDLNHCFDCLLLDVERLEAEV